MRESTDRAYIQHIRAEGHMQCRTCTVSTCTAKRGTEPRLDTRMPSTGSQNGRNCDGEQPTKGSEVTTLPELWRVEERTKGGKLPPSKELGDIAQAIIAITPPPPPQPPPYQSFHLLMTPYWISLERHLHLLERQLYHLRKRVKRYQQSHLVERHLHLV